MGSAVSFGSISVLEAFISINSREQQPVSHSGGAHGELRAFDQTRETEERSGGIDTN